VIHACQPFGVAAGRKDCVVIFGLCGGQLSSPLNRGHRPRTPFAAAQGAARPSLRPRRRVSVSAINPRATARSLPTDDASGDFNGAFRTRACIHARPCARALRSAPLLPADKMPGAMRAIRVQARSLGCRPRLAGQASGSSAKKPAAFARAKRARGGHSSEYAVLPVVIFGMAETGFTLSIGELLAPARASISTHWAGRRGRRLLWQIRDGSTNMVRPDGVDHSRLWSQGPAAT